MLRRWFKNVAIRLWHGANPDVDELHKWEVIPIDNDGFCTCHGYDCVYRGRPRRNIQ